MSQTTVSPEENQEINLALAEKARTDMVNSYVGKYGQENFDALIGLAKDSPDMGSYTAKVGEILGADAGKFNPTMLQNVGFQKDLTDLYVLAQRDNPSFELDQPTARSFPLPPAGEPIVEGQLDTPEPATARNTELKLPSEEEVEAEIAEANTVPDTMSIPGMNNPLNAAIQAQDTAAETGTYVPTKLAGVDPGKAAKVDEATAAKKMQMDPFAINPNETTLTDFLGNIAVNHPQYFNEPLLIAYYDSLDKTKFENPDQIHPLEDGISTINTLKGLADRSLELAGNLSNFTDSAGRVLDQNLPTMGFAFTDDGFKVMTGDEWREYNTSPENNVMRKLGDTLKEVDTGYEQGTSWRTVQNSDQALEAVANFLLFGLEAGAVSLPDMAMAVTATPTYMLARSEEIALARAKNNGRSIPNARDLMEGSAVAAIVAMSEKFGADKVLQSLIQSGGKIPQRFIVGMGGEAGTEFVQEQIEYAGETVGTELGNWSLDESLTRGYQGVAGGVAIGGVAATLGTVKDKLGGNIQRQVADSEQRQEINALYSAFSESGDVTQLPEIDDPLFDPYQEAKVIGELLQKEGVTPEQQQAYGDRLAAVATKLDEKLNAAVERGMAAAEAKDEKGKKAAMDEAEQLMTAHSIITSLSGKSSTVYDAEQQTADITAVVEAANQKTPKTPEIQQATARILGSIQSGGTEVPIEGAQAILNNESIELTPVQRNMVKSYAVARERTKQFEDMADVNTAVLRGTDGFLGGQQHQAGISEALNLGSDTSVKRRLGAFKDFVVGHTNKLKTLQEAYDNHVAGVPNSPELEARMDALAAQRTSGERYTMGAGTPKLIAAITDEVRALRAQYAASVAQVKAAKEEQATPSEVTAQRTEQARKASQPKEKPAVTEEESVGLSTTESEAPKKTEQTEAEQAPKQEESSIEEEVYTPVFGDVVRYEKTGQPYLVRGITANGGVQLTSVQGKNFSGTPQPDKLTKIDSLETGTYNGVVYAVSKNGKNLYTAKGKTNFTSDNPQFAQIVAAIKGEQAPVEETAPVIDDAPPIGETTAPEPVAQQEEAPKSQTSTKAQAAQDINSDASTKDIDGAPVDVRGTAARILRGLVTNETVKTKKGDRVTTNLLKFNWRAGKAKDTMIQRLVSPFKYLKQADFTTAMDTLLPYAPDWFVKAVNADPQSLEVSANLRNLNNLLIFAEGAPGSDKGFNSILRKVLKAPDAEKKAFGRPRSPVLFFFDENNEIDPAVFDAMSVAAFNWLAEAASNVNRSDAEIADLLSLSSTDEVTDAMREQYQHFGDVKEFVAEKLGKEVMQMLNLHIDPKLSTEADKRKMEASVGMTIIGALAEANLIDTAEGGLPTAKLGSPDSASTHETDVVRLRTKQNEYGQAVAENDTIQDMIESSKGGGNRLVSDLFGATTYYRYPRFDEPASKEKRFTRRALTAVNDAINKVLNRHEKRKHVFKETAGIFNQLSESAQLRIAGYKDNAQAYTVKGMLRSIEAKNTAIATSLGHWKDFIKMAEGKDGFYFTHQVWRNLRMGIDSNTINPQGDKLHRALIGMAGWVTRVNKGSPKAMDRFHLAVAQAMDIEVDKFTGGRKELLAADGKYFTLINSNVIKKGVAAVMDMSQPNAEADLVAAVEAIGNGPHGLEALTALAALEKSGDAKSFKTDITMEVDGITNGVIIGLLQLGAGKNKADLLNKIGRGGLISESGVSGMEKWRNNPNNLDSYKAIARVWVDKMRDHFKELNRIGEPEMANHIRAIHDLFGGLTSKKDGGEEVLTSIARKLTKNPLMVTIYGAGYRSVLEKMEESFIDHLYESLQGEIDTIREAVKGLSDAAKKPLIAEHSAATLAKLNKERGFVDLVNQLLGDKAPHIPQFTTMQQVRDFQLTGKQIAVLKSRLAQKPQVDGQPVAASFFDGLSTAIDEEYVDFKRVRTELNTAMQMVANMYNEAHRQMYEQELENSPEGTRILKGYQVERINKALAALFPGVHSYFSSHDGRPVDQRLQITGKAEERVYAERDERVPDNQTRNIVNLHGQRYLGTKPVFFKQEDVFYGVKRDGAEYKIKPENYQYIQNGVLLTPAMQAKNMQGTKVVARKEQVPYFKSGSKHSAAWRVDDVTQTGVGNMGNMHVLQDVVGEVGVRPNILLIHSLDAAIMTMMLENHEAMNIHDAGIFGLNNMEKAGQGLNIGMKAVSENFSIVKEVEKSLKDALRAVAKVSEEHDLDASQIFDMGSLVAAYKDEDGEIVIPHPEDYLNDTLSPLATEQQENTKDALSAVKRYEQYSFPGTAISSSVDTPAPESTVSNEGTGALGSNPYSDTVLDPDNFQSTLEDTVDNMSSEAMFDHFVNHGHLKPSASHASRLRDVLRNLVNKVGFAVNVHVQDRTDVESMGVIKGDDIYLINQLGGVGTTGSRLSHGMRMSTAEVYVHELIHRVTHTGLNQDSMSRRQMLRLYQEVRKNLAAQPEPWRAFLNDPTIQTNDPAYQDEVAAAKARYNYVFNPEATQQRYQNVDEGTGLRTGHNTSNALDEFVAFGMTNEHFRNTLAQMSGVKMPSKLFGGMQGMNLQEMLATLFDRIMDIITMRLTEVAGQGSASAQMDQLVADMLKVENRYKGMVLSSLDAASRVTHKGVEVAFNTTNKVLNKIANTELVRNTSSRLVRTAAGSIRLANDSRGGESVRHLLSSLSNQMTNRRYGYMQSLLTEMRGLTERNASLIGLARKSNKLIDQMRKHVSDVVRDSVNSSFLAPLSDYQKSVLTKTLLKTDLITLMERGSVFTESYDLAQLQELLDDSTKLDQEIDRLQQIVRNDPDIAGFEHFYLRSATATAYYMVHGVALEKHTLLNAHNIVNLAGFSNVNRPSEAAIERNKEILDKLISLQALSFTATSQRTELSNIITAENTNTEGNGVMATMMMHKELKQESQTRLFNNDPALMIKGYIKDSMNPEVSVKQAPLASEAELARKGYVRLPTPLKRDPRDPETGDMYMYVSKYGSLQQYMAGILSLTDNNARGSNTVMIQEQLGSDHRTARRQGRINQASINRQVQADLQEMLLPNYRNPRASSKPNFMVPIVSPTGKITGHRYMMKDETKDSLLERDTRFDTVLGGMAAGIIDKQNSRMVSRDLAYALKQHYDQYGSTQAAGFVMIGPNSTDPRMQELYRMFPQHMRDAVRNAWGGNTIYVPKDMVDLAFGFRKISVMNLFEQDPATLNAGKRLMVDVASRVLGPQAAARLKRAENWIQELVSMTKDIIVVKSFVVTLGNWVSNTMFLRMKGVPVSKAIVWQHEAFQSTIRYQKDKAELDKLRMRLKTHQMNPQAIADAKQRIAELEHEIAINPVTELIDAGIMQSIVDDVDAMESNSPFKGDIAKVGDKVLDKMPSWMQTSTKLLTISHDTKIYKTLNNFVRLSDFIGRYALYKHMTEKEVNPTPKAEALNEITHLFVNFDLPTHRINQYLNDMGIWWFSKYMLRIQMVLLETLKKNPVDTLQVLMLQNFFGDYPDIYESLLVLERNPLTSFGTPVTAAMGAADDAVTFEMMGQVYGGL